MQHLFFERIKNMKKIAKILISVILCLTDAFCSLIPAFATEPKTAFIVVSGMNTFPLYKDSEKVFPTSTKTIMKLASKIVLPLIEFLKDGNYDKLGDALFPAAEEAFDDLACNPDGSSKYEITTDLFPMSAGNYPDSFMNEVKDEGGVVRAGIEAFGADNTYFFNYDWRLDACENADRLNDFIDLVKSKTGKSKVTLVGGSEGTVVASAYIDKYKNKNDLEKLVLIDGAFCGVGVANAFKQDLYIDKDVLMSYVDEFCQTYSGSDINTGFLSLLIGLLPGVVDSLCNYLNDVIDDEAMLTSVYNDVLKPLGNIPVLWEFIPYDSFYSAVNKMSEIGFLDKSSGLYDKIVRYHGVQGRVESNLKELKNKGVQIAIIANYGTPGIPITSGYKNQTDILIDTKYASAGATVADYGKKLSSTGKYVSEDKIIDASSCILPDNTWFVKGIQHMNFWWEKPHK